MRTSFHEICKADKNHCLRLRCFSYVHCSLSALSFFTAFYLAHILVYSKPKWRWFTVYLIHVWADPIAVAQLADSYWAQLLQGSVLPARAKRGEKPFGKQVPSWTKVCSTKQEEMPGSTIQHGPSSQGRCYGTHAGQAINFAVTEWLLMSQLTAAYACTGAQHPKRVLVTATSSGNTEQQNSSSINRGQLAMAILALIKLYPYGF